MKTELIGHNLELLGRQYKSDYLSGYENLCENAWEALKFFFAHTFMRGRRDELSMEYYEFTIKVLADYLDFIADENPKSLYDKLDSLKKQNLLSTTNIRKLKSSSRNSIKHPDFKRKISKSNSLIRNLTSTISVDIEYPKGNPYSKDISLNNDADLLMVIETLNFMGTSIAKTNIFGYFDNMFKQDKLNIAYRELNSISGIGDKLSTFFLRDLAIMESYELNDNQIEYIFPVDTWIAQIASLLSNNRFSASKPYEVKEYFAENYSQHYLPLINAGLWYLGSNSLTIAIDSLEKNKLTTLKYGV